MFAFNQLMYGLMVFYVEWKASLLRMICVDPKSPVEDSPLYDDPEMETWFRNVCHI